MYLPKRYFTGLSKTKRAQRKRELTKRAKLSWKSQKAYRPFKTDVGVKTRKSKYTLEWKTKFPNVKSIPEASKVTGVPVSAIQESYNRGVAAWRTGHRPGASKEQWGVARYRSMLLCGKTHYTTDSDLVRNAKKKSAKARRWFNKTCKTSPVKYNK
jgi:hypothetical protein